MTNMKTIYLVTHGDYSDYGVLGVFSSKAKAELAQKLWAADSIAEFELDEMPKHPRGKFWYCVTMDAAGNTGYGGVKIENATGAHNKEYEPYGSDDLICFYMWAKDGTHAVKIANERRAQLIALNLWKESADWDLYREELARNGAKRV